MGLLDNGDRVSDAELDAKAGDSLTSDFTQGLRSGYQSAKGQLHKLAGTTMNALGADGSEQNAKSKVAQAYAQVEGQDLVPFEQADVGRNGLRWLAGALGQSAPISAAITGAGLATGGAGFVPAMLAGTAAGAPFKAGEILQRQEADPANRYVSPAQHLANAALPAVASAGVESAIPAFTTMRLAGKTGLPTVGQIAGRTAASVPAEGLSEGAGELALQAGLNQMNPNAGYDWEAIKQNAIQGAVVGGALGTVGGVGEVGHKIASSPGSMKDAVAGLVPDSVKKRLESAKSGLAGAAEAAGEATDAATEYAKDGFDHTAEAAAKAAEWTKGAISAKVADVQKWGKEFMDDPAAPDSFKAQVQEAVRNPGDKAKAVWLATEKFARDAAAKVSKEADAADIPSKLRALHKTMSDGAGRLKDRLASGGEPADDAEILAAGDDPAKLTEVFDRADKSALEKTQEWAKDLLAEHLTDEQKAKLKTWTDNITDKASVQGIAALHKAQAAGKDLAERASAFAKAARSTPAGKAVEGAIATARTTDAGKAVEGAARSVKDAFTPKKSDAIPEGLREKIGESIMDVLGPYHPALKSKFVRNANGETTVPLQDLADGLRSVIIAASNGEAVSSDALAKLIDVAGPKTRELIDAVHRAVGEPAAGNAAFFQAIEDAVQAGRANESVLAVMQKSLKPELQGAVRTDELKKEAELLRLWLQSNDAKGKLSKPEITHRDEVMRSAIEHRYGDKAEAVLRAIRANIAKEQKLTEASEGVNPLSSDDDMREGPAGVNTGRREGSARDETVRSHFYADGKKGEELYLAPEHAPPSKFKSPAEQRMVKAKTANPDAQVEFRYVKDLDESDPKVEAMISAKFDELVETAMLEQGMTEAEAESWANKELDKYGLVVAESSRQETRITDAELASLKLDSKFADSPSRIDSKGPATEENTHPKTKRRTDGNVALDAVRITEFMNKKMGAVHEYSPTDDKGRRHRDARMFTEGIAALTDRLGYSFDIPDSTQITRQGMTWGEAKKLDVRTPKDKGYDAKSQELDRQRASYRSADPTAKANLRQMAEETLQKRADAKDKELSRDGFDAPPLDDISAEIANRIARIKELEAQRDGLDLTTRAGRAKEKILFAEQAAIENINLRTGFHNVRQEVDPFGPTHDAMRGRGEFRVTDAGSKNRSAEQTIADVRGEDVGSLPKDSEILTNADGSAREDTVMGRRRPAVSNPDATKGTSFTPRKTKDELITEGNHAALQALRTKERQLARKLRQLDAVLRKDMTRKEAAALQRVQGMSPEAREELINTLHAKYVETEDAGEAEAAARGGPPSPKTVAAKKAAFLKKALSGDAELLKTLKASTDAKGLQRAAMALQGKPEAQKALDAINARLSELVQDEDVAYGLQTKKYSLTATHVSNARHDGVFDWRTHWRTGQRDAKVGAGTYIRPAEQTASTEHFKNMIRGLAPESGNFHPGEPATYNVILHAEPHELMLWDAPFSKQPKEVQEGLIKAARALGVPEKQIAAIISEDVPAHEIYGDDLYNRVFNLPKVSDALDKAGIVGARYNSARGHEYVIYRDSRLENTSVEFSAQYAHPGQTGPVDRGAVERHIEKVLGPNVGVAWKNILHAGEFTRTATADVISLSMHSLNPMSTAYHESLHGLFARLRDAKQGDIAAVLERAGESAPVMNQLKKLLANEPGALAQLGNAEERAAYMYQFWSQRDAKGNRLLNVGDKATSIFQRIAKFLREVTGLWTNDERAVKIMEYFQSGEYEKTRSDPNAVHRALMEPGITRPLAKLKAMAEPFTDLGEALVSAGGERLRDSGIPALRQLADAMKLKTTSEGDDPGYLPTSRAEHARRMNQLGADLKPYTEDEIKEATVAMQEGVQARSPHARLVQRVIRKHLDKALDYMQAAGVNIDHIGAGPKADGVPYFPRSWDASYISSHQKEFLAMADKYVQSGEWKGDPQKTMNKLMVTDGAEFNVEVDKPGMQPSKQRVLNFISHADAAPFMRKDLHQIMNNYLLQATRRAEWSRRFGDDGVGVAMMLIAAKAEGATPEQLEMATKFIRAVDGTLGDTLNPTARRMMGNMIVYQNIRLLPLAIFSSIVDPVGLMVRGGTMRDAFNAFKRGVKESVKNFQDDPAGDSMTQLAEAIGTIENASLVHTMGASYGQGMVGDKGRAINDAFFRYNLMDQYNRSMRTTATEAALGFLTRHATNPNAHSARYLRELGLTAADVQLDANGRPKLFETDGLTTAHSNRMLAAVNRWVDGAVLRPDAVDKALWMSDPHFALVSHLKSFVLSFHETILKRVAHEARNGNYTPAMALASYVPVMLAADMVKGLIQGGGEEPPWKKSWGLSDYAWNSMERAGLFGSGQFAIDALTDITQRGGSGIGALTGPTVEQLTDAVRVLGGDAQFRPFAVKSLPANALYAGVLGNESTDPKFVE